MKGRPILGTISGFFLGLFGGITLFLFGVIPLHSPLLWILPIVGIALGLLMSAWAPFGSGAKKHETTVSAPSPTSRDAEGDAPGRTIEFDVVEDPEDGMGNDA